MYGTSLRGGLLLYGPPGCGKTYLARALAGELGTRFIRIGLTDVLDMWFGNSEQRVHALFEFARSHAPTLIFLDELDALGHSRTNLRNSPMRSVVAQLLVELDGAADSNEDVFVLAATNQPWEIDPALRRPGRFDRQVFVPPPDPDARAEILEQHLRSRPLAGDLDLADLAGRTGGYSGADIAAAVNDAAQQALVDSIESGTPRPISTHDLRRAISQRKPTTGPWFDMAQNVLAFANRSGEYDDLREYVETKRSGGRRRAR
jgi:SpoVK/Ycf46/Vps4 family AAA+-type ATPase